MADEPPSDSPPFPPIDEVQAWIGRPPRATEPPFICPWENPDGSTNVDGWLAAYAEDDNTFWRTEQGHIMNVVDALIERLDDAR